MSRYTINSSIEHCFKILVYLHEYGVTQCKVFADMFNVSDKQVRRYIYSLRKAGIDIKFKSGPHNGGYYLEDNKCPLCEKEWE